MQDCNIIKNMLCIDLQAVIEYSGMKRRNRIKLLMLSNNVLTYKLYYGNIQA